MNKVEQSISKRFLLKLSGEALNGTRDKGYDDEEVTSICKDIASVLHTESADGAKTQVAIVIGGGNYWRGRTSGDMDRVKADQIGMLATVMNCLYVSDKLRLQGIKTRIMTPFACGGMTELFNKDRALEALEDGQVVFFAGGTGHPYFSTDMATALMAIEIEADAILAGKSIDGVYDSDPNKNPDAKKYDYMEMQDIVDHKLGVIDLAAAVLCMENHMPMYMFGLEGADCIIQAVKNYTMLTQNGVVTAQVVQESQNNLIKFGTYIHA